MQWKNNALFFFLRKDSHEFRFGYGVFFSFNSLIVVLTVWMVCRGWKGRWVWILFIRCKAERRYFQSKECISNEGIQAPWPASEARGPGMRYSGSFRRKLQPSITPGRTGRKRAARPLFIYKAPATRVVLGGAECRLAEWMGVLQYQSL